MKKLHKSTSLVTLFVLLFSLIIPASAVDETSASLPSIQIGEKIGNCTVVDIQEHTLSTDEVVDYYMTEKGYSLEAAQEQALQLLLASESISTTVVTVNATDDLGITSNIEIGCRVLMSSSGARSCFKEILDSWTGIVSSGIQQWNEFTHSATIVGAKRVSIDFYARGTIDVAISRSTSQGISIQLLESLGYSVESSTSTTYYARKVVDLKGSYTLPGYTYP